MQATAKLSNYRQSPRKARLIARLVAGKKIDLALAELTHLEKRSAPVFAKLLKSAEANAKALGMDAKDLVVKEFRVDKGLVMKRFRPRAFGRASGIKKRSCHILIVLEGAEIAQAVKASKKTATKESAPKKTTAAAPKRASAKKTTAK